MRELFQHEKNYVIDSWISGYNARGIPGVLKVLLICSQTALLVERIANRDNSTIESAKQHLKDREEANLTKWTRLYGDQGFFDPKNFDLVIDTYSSGPMETVGKVLDKLEYS